MICQDCKTDQPIQRPRKRCADCYRRAEQSYLANLAANGDILCLCGCGQRAESVYMTDRCYAREYQRQRRGNDASLLAACPLRYHKPQKPALRPTDPRPYTGLLPENRIVDHLFHDELLAALEAVQEFTLIGEGIRA